MVWIVDLNSILYIWEKNHLNRIVTQFKIYKIYFNLHHNLNIAKMLNIIQFKTFPFYFIARFMCREYRLLYFVYGTCKCPNSSLQMIQKKFHKLFMLYTWQSWRARRGLFFWFILFLFRYLRRYLYIVQLNIIYVCYDYT